MGFERGGKFVVGHFDGGDIHALSQVNAQYVGQLGVVFLDSVLLPELLFLEGLQVGNRLVDGRHGRFLRHEKRLALPGSFPKIDAGKRQGGHTQNNPEPEAVAVKIFVEQLFPAHLESGADVFDGLQRIDHGREETHQAGIGLNLQEAVVAHELKSESRHGIDTFFICRKTVCHRTYGKPRSGIRRKALAQAVFGNQLQLV